MRLTPVKIMFLSIYAEKIFSEKKTKFSPNEPCRRVATRKVLGKGLFKTLLIKKF